MTTSNLMTTAGLVMVPEAVRIVPEKMMNAPSATVVTTALTATVQVPKAETMSEQGEPLIEESRVNRLLDMHKEQMGLADQAEFYLMQALWELRGSYSIDDMARWMRCSRQTVYNKWGKHGFEIKDDNAKPRTDQE